MPSDMRKKHIENRRQSFETGAVVLLLSTAIVKITGAMFKIPLSNLLGDDGAGYFSSAYDLFTPFYAMAMSGLPVAAARMFSAFSAGKKYKDIKQLESITHKMFWIIGAVGIVLFLLLLPLFILATDRSGNTKYGLLAVAPSVLLFCVMSFYRGVFEGMENMTPTAVSDVIEAFGKLLLGYGFAWFVLERTGSKVYAAAAALLGITVGVAVATLYLALKYHFSGDGISESLVDEAPEACSVRQMRLDFISFMLPVTLSAVLVTVFASITDALTVQSCLRTAGFDDPVALYGIRSKAFTLYNLIPSVTASIGVSAVPKLSAAFAENNREELKKRTVGLLKLASLIAIPAGVGLFAMSRSIMTLLYVSENAGGIGAELLNIYGAAAVFTGLSVVIIHALQAMGYQRRAICVLAFGMVIKVVLNIILVSNPDIGILGAAYSTLFSYLIVLAVGLSLLIRAVGIRKPYRIFLKPVIASLVCIPAGLIAENCASDKVTIVAILAAIVLYFALIFALKTFTVEEIEAFPGGKKLKKFFVKHKKAQ